jgi:hypothetical protein
MTNENEFDQLAELFGQIERAWVDHRDRRVVQDLSERHPEFREELREFFADLVLGPDGPSEKIAKADERISQWLSTSGFEIASAALVRARSTPQTTRTTLPSKDPSHQGEASGSVDQEKPILYCPLEQKNWLFFLRKRTKQSLPCLVSELTNVTTEYLILVSRHPNVVPINVKTRIAEEIERAWGVPVHESFECLSDNPNLVRAASRSEPFANNPKSFKELLDRTSLNDKQKDYWQRYSGSNK